MVSVGYGSDSTVVVLGEGGRWGISDDSLYTDDDARRETSERLPILLLLILVSLLYNVCLYRFLFLDFSIQYGYLYLVGE